MPNAASANILHDESPLISPSFLKKLTTVLSVLAIVTIALNFAGNWYGKRIAMASHTDSIALHDLVIGMDHLRLPANVIRLPGQRANGTTEKLHLYLHWPSMTGYSSLTASAFNSTSGAAPLIFLEITQRVMSRDMSGRFEPIYLHLFTDTTKKGPYGLTMNEFKPETGYGNEVMLSSGQSGAEDFYAVRCILPKEVDRANSADCQRDIAVGEDLSVQYRFSSSLLKDWRAIDDAVKSYIETHLAG